MVYKTTVVTKGILMNKSLQKSHPQKLVSVVITAYNHRRYIASCLDSIVRQTYPRWELIVVDDASTDGTSQRIHQWMSAQSAAVRRRVRLLTRAQNGGYARALTDGLRAARGYYVAMQDSDDLSHPDRLRRQVAYLERHPQIGMVGTRYRVITHGRVDPAAQPLWLKHGVRAIRAHYAQGGHCICVGTLLLRRALVTRFGGPAGRIKGAEDYEFIAKMIGAGVAAQNLHAVLYDYRAHEGQRSRKFYGS